MTHAFDLTLAFPQWQGSGRSTDLPRGAAAAAEVCARFAPLATVPLSDAAGDAHGVNRWNALFDQFAGAQAILARTRPQRLLTVGGDCAVDIAPIDYLNTLYPDLSIVWIDTHPDANTPATSPSGNLHGMPVSAIMGHAPAPMRQRMGAPVDPARFFYYGIREGDEADWVFQRDRGLGMFEPGMRLSGPVHVHFDLDVLEPAEFPHLAYATPGGLPVADGVALLKRIADENDLVGLTITEFAPADEAGARDGSRVIARLCEAAGCSQG